MKTTVGRVVHFYPAGSPRPFAAIVTNVHNDQLVDLAVLSTTALAFQLEVGFRAEASDQRQTWRWPPRESEASLVKVPR